ncbi:hypothetical protein [[Scytonema hofmanni] UTEX B 1581]|uniref:hypothetical protein n=1 Tax=[Scytonema hofmanni] UTEX B 1581 TaxID=379535 RepID=UPI0004968F9B|nr:hypothetical protein [[Scytonema hofmanni] UTEX B 1581]
MERKVLGEYNSLLHWHCPDGARTNTNILAFQPTEVGFVCVAANYIRQGFNFRVAGLCPE